MTDGIIQEVLLEVLVEDNPHTDTIVTVNKFADRLIEKIKQEIGFNCKHSCGVCVECHCIINILIGDNQE